MTSWWAFPPNTRKVEFDEKWSFVGKKEAHCDRAKPADDLCGDHWDHVAFDPEHRLVLSLVCGRRTEDHSRLLVEDCQERTGGRLLALLCSDENPAYATAILAVYGEEVVPERTGRPGRPAAPYRVAPEGLNYATVHKERQGGRVIAVTTRTVYGSAGAEGVSTSHLERFNGTDRNRNGRKVRKAYTFSKDWDVHEAMSAFTIFSYNFCWPVRTLRERGADRTWQPRTPAMAAGLADHVWSLAEWLTLPGVDRIKTVHDDS